MSRNPYLQVALTYVRRSFSSWLTAIVGTVVLAVSIYFILLVFFVLQRVPVTVAVKPNETVTLRVRNMYPDDQTDFAGIGAMLLVAGFFSGFLAMHTKEQFVESRSHLMPDFRRVHIAVAAVATLILAIVAPAILSWLIGMQSIGLVAITVCVFGAMFWLVLDLSNWMVWPILTMMLFSLSQSARHALVVLVSGQFEASAMGLLALGVTIIVLAGMRLFRLNEDMPEYHRRMPTGWAAKGRMTGQNVNYCNYDVPGPRIVTDRLLAQAMADLTRHVQRASCSWWSGICRWQTGMPTGWRVWLWAIFPIALQLFFVWQLPTRTPSGAPFRMVNNALVVLPLILAMPQFLGWLTMRNRMSGYELTLPVERRAYVRQAIGALALGYFQLWSVISATEIVWLLVVITPPSPSAYVASVAAVALLIQIALFGTLLFAWTSISAHALRTAVFVVCMLPLILLSAFGCDDMNAQVRPWTFPTSVGVAALGVTFTYFAYRRWLVADFD